MDAGPRFRARSPRSVIRQRGWPHRAPTPDHGVLLKALFTTLILTLLVALSAAQGTPTCPVLDKPIPTDAPTLLYRGLRVSFCCAQCESTFKAAPKTYLVKPRTAGQFVADSLFDPVTKTRVAMNVGVKSAIHDGIRYPFTDDESLAKFQADPVRYTAFPMKESLVCPVMRNGSESHLAAFGYADHEGVRYYFCCGGCETTFAEDPAKYAATVSAHVRSVTPGKGDSGRLLMPTCAGCAGEARLMGADGLPTQWNIAYRYININSDPAARHRFTIDYALTPRLSVGLERSGSDPTSSTGPGDGVWNYFRRSDGDTLVLPRASWFITPEGPTHPSLVLGFTADRLSTPKGQAFFLTASKAIPKSMFTPFVSIKTNTLDGKTVFPFGVNARLTPEWTLQVINDGDYTHFLGSRIFDWGTGSVILARGKYLGFGLSFGF